MCMYFKVLLGVLLSFCMLSVDLSAEEPLAVPILANADPFITLNPVNGQYLLLATSRQNITLWRGPTIDSAAIGSRVLFTPTDGLTEIWSPTIWQRGGKWWIYFTARAVGKEHAIYVLESDTKDAWGSYTFRGALDLGRPAIDPSILTVKGIDYLMYVTVDRGENAISMVRLEDPREGSDRRAGVSLGEGRRQHEELPGRRRSDGALSRW